MQYTLSKAGINALPLPTKNNQVLYPDPEARFHYVRVTTNGARSFVVDRNTSRGRIRITLGPAGTDAMTSQQARRAAAVVLGLIEQGYTPGQIKDHLARANDAIPAGAVTLSQVFDEYLQDRRGKLSERTKADYRRLMDTYLKDWKNRPVETITDDDIRARFHAIEAPSQANYVGRFLRGLFNLAMSMKNEAGQPLIASNPAAILSARKLWHEQKPKREVIGLAALPAWWAAVDALAIKSGAKRDEAGQFKKGNDALNGNGETVRDFLLFVLLTGLRKSEAANLQWANNVDLAARQISIPMPKNREPHTLPLSDFLYKMLTRRHAAMLKDNDPIRKPFVFSGATGPLAEPKKQIAKVIRSSGVSFSLHTLRRTFASIAESLDIPYLALKRLINHKAQDVTGKHYTVITAERLREPMQKITDFTLKAAKVGKNTKATKSAKAGKA